MFGYIWYDKIDDELITSEQAEETCKVCKKDYDRMGYDCGQVCGECEALQMLDLGHFLYENPFVFGEVKKAVKKWQKKR